MKKIVIVYGGPRKGMNTAQLLQRFAEGAKLAWRDEHWQEDLQRAYDAGRKMAEQ